jgi:hypothetical protein
MTSRLHDTLADVGKPAVNWSSPDGSTVLVLPYGGRVLGLFAPGSERNFFWTHTALNSVDAAKAFYASTDWHNSGGDRTWLAPEVDFFLPEYPNLSVYMQPRTLDPGRYELLNNNGTIALKNHMVAQLSRSKAAVELEITKRIAPSKNPLTATKSRHAKDLEYAGYALHTRLEIKGPDPAVGPVGLWSLLQLPHGGELLVPTTSKSSVQKYFGDLNPSDVVVTETLVRYKMHSAGEQKIAMTASGVGNRMGYISSEGDASALIVREFSINPLGEYIDVPWAHPDSPGAAVEACNVNSNLGAFSEMEYHTPAIGGLTGLSSCEDVSQVWAFRGSHQSILAAARELVSPDA